MAISPTYGTGTYNSRIPAVSIPKISTAGGIASPLDFFPSTRSSSSGNLVASSQQQQDDNSLLGSIKPSTAIKGGKKLYDNLLASTVDDLLPGLGVTTAATGLDFGTAMSGLDVGTSVSGMAGSDIFGLADAYGWGEMGSSVASSSAANASSAFIADVGGFQVPWLAGVDNLFEGDVTGAAEDTIGAAIGYTFGGPIGGFIGSTVAGPVFEAASDIVEDIGDALGSVICTHLHATGNLSTYIYLADSAYGRKLLLHDPAVYYGYRRWADTVVSWMKSSTIILKAVKYLAMPIIIALAEKENNEIKSSAYGRFALSIGTSICRYLGKNLPQTAAMKCGV